ncbi:MAG: hypothetical protein KAS77_08865 [Thermoplasmata archaeon]|jgi:glutaredoxin 2|nr:hypothetical protein [Thermoplasmata archaeon]
MTKQVTQDEARRAIEALEREIDMKDRLIQMRVALDYLTEFIDPSYREEFITAERAARTEEEMTRLLIVARRHIAQKTLIEILDIDI